VRSQVREAVAPAYLFVCLLLGGSAQGIWTNAALQLAGIAIIVWAAMVNSEGPLSRQQRQLVWITLAGLMIVVLQLVPLPGSLWPELSGRARLADGYRILGVPPPALPLSVAPYSSLETVLTITPAVALFCAIVRLRAYRPSWLAFGLLAGTIAGVLLGALQVTSAGPGSSPWYPYPQSNFGYATGFFANVNHMATLLVISLPFLAALLAAAPRQTVHGRSAAVVLVAGAALVILVGLALNRSLAGYGLTVPVLAASLLIVVPTARRTQRWAIAAAAALVLASVIALVVSPVGAKNFGSERSVSSRAEILNTTSEAIGDFLPFGSGLGTFRPVYKLYEDPARVDRITMPHAHNDYAQMALELGIPGVILMVVFLLWWASATARAWRVPGAPFSRAASIASAAILVHSIVDYPLRTAAISACFAMCLTLLAEQRVRRGGDKSELWSTRHVVLR
jgi:O-antigen ligase